MGIRVLVYSDAPNVDTGFGRVTQNILPRLEKLGYDVHIMGINWYGDIPQDTKRFNFPIYPVDKGSLDNMYAYGKFWYIEEKVKPDLIFSINDPWVTKKLLQHRPQDYKRYTKLITYYPTDAGPMKQDWVDMLNKFDAQICYSNFAERVYIESNGGKRPDNLYQMYHGVDTENFYPVNQGMARGELDLPQDAFIVGMVARNQYRKRFDLLVKAFSEFAKDKKDAKLYLHTATLDVGYDIIDLAAQFDLKDKLILTEGVTPSKGVPEKILNLIYNSLDVNCLISLGDGFGLPVAESMAVGTPQLVSDNSCLKELVEGHGGLTVKNAAWILNTNGVNTWGGVSDVKDMVDKLNVLYDNKDLRLELAQQGYDFITQERFNWDYIVSQLDDIIKKTFHILPVKDRELVAV